MASKDTQVDKKPDSKQTSIDEVLYMDHSYSKKVDMLLSEYPYPIQKTNPSTTSEGIAQFSSVRNIADIIKRELPENILRHNNGADKILASYIYNTLPDIRYTAGAYNIFPSDSGYPSSTLINSLVSSFNDIHTLLRHIKPVYFFEQPLIAIENTNTVSCILTGGSLNVPVAIIFRTRMMCLISDGINALSISGIKNTDNADKIKESFNTRRLVIHKEIISKANEFIRYYDSISAFDSNDQMKNSILIGGMLRDIASRSKDLFINGDILRIMNDTAKHLLVEKVTKDTVSNSSLIRQIIYTYTDRLDRAKAEITRSLGTKIGNTLEVFNKFGYVYDDGKFIKYTKIVPKHCFSGSSVYKLNDDVIKSLYIENIKISFPSFHTVADSALHPNVNESDLNLCIGELEPTRRRIEEEGMSKESIEAYLQQLESTMGIINMNSSYFETLVEWENTETGEIKFTSGSNHRGYSRSSVWKMKSNNRVRAYGKEVPYQEVVGSQKTATNKSKTIRRLT